MIKTLCIDPGTDCGWAHSNGHHGIMRLGVSAPEHQGNKLVRLYDRLWQFADSYGVERLVVEDAFAGAKGQADGRAHGHMMGLFLFFSARQEVPIRTIHPMTLHKFATGDGRATKYAMMAACRERLGIEVFTHDEADALWMLEMAKVEQWGPMGAARKKKKTADQAPTVQRLSET